MNTPLGQVVHQNRKKDTEIPREAKTKGVHHHWTDLTRNVRGTSLSQKNRAQISKRKIYKSINITSKGKCYKI